MSNKEESPPGKEKPEAAGDNRNIDPVYYYSRERRLSRASPAVQALNDGKFIRPNLSKSLFGTKSNAVIFMLVVFFIAVFGLASRFSGLNRGVKLGGNTIAVSILREESVLILGIAKNMPKSGEAYIGAVDIAVSPVMSKPKEGEAQEMPPVFVHRIFFNTVDSETFQVVLPFDGTDFLVVLKTDSEQKSLRLKAEGKKL